MFGLAKEKWQDVVLSVNVHRKTRRLSPAEVGRCLNVALQQTDIETLADRLNFKDTTLLRKIARLADLPPDVASMVDWGARKGSLSMSSATEIQRLNDPELIRQAAIAAVENDFSRAEARQLVQIHTRTGVPLPTCVESVLATRPKIERSELIIGSFLTEKSKSACTQLGNDAAARAILLRLARRLPDVTARALRINGDRFSLLLSAEDGTRLRQLIAPDSVEGLLSQFAEQIS
jgi:hypothetical protein